MTKEVILLESSYGIQGRAVKERTVGFVVERVSVWRKLYTGVQQPLRNGGGVRRQRYSLSEAARLVGLSKKSLDDYLLQIRFGKMLNFDFSAHRNSPIGTLRHHVRTHKPP